MNAPIRRVAVAALILFLALLMAVTIIQVFAAPNLNADPRNRRTLYKEYNNHRGQIIVDGNDVAFSEPSDDDYGYQRVYREGELYAHVTGFYSVVVGRSELERYGNDVLNGSSDSLWLDRLRTIATGADPQGSSIEATIDPKLQEVAAKALGAQRGAVVALDIRTGAVLAMVSSPTYDPNELAEHNRGDVAQRYDDLLKADGDPLINRAIAGETYPPGSVFKLVTAAAALETPGIETDELDGSDGYQLPQSSHILRNFGGATCSSTGRIDLADALRISCNTAFAELGNLIGDDQLRSQARAFGFDSRVQIPMPVTPSRFPDSLDAPQTALAAIGQGSVRVTPLQVAMVSAAIANDGIVMSPYLIDRIRTPDLRIADRTEPHEIGRAVSSKTASALTAMMVEVVNSGSGKRAAIRGAQVAGKTGTAQANDGEPPHAWFTGFAPADDPQIAVAVVVENGGDAGSEATGGAVAAPIVAAVLDAGVQR